MVRKINHQNKNKEKNEKAIPVFLNFDTNKQTQGILIDFFEDALVKKNELSKEEQENLSKTIKNLPNELEILKKEKENTNEEKELIEKGKIPQCYYENLELIQLGDEKLKEIKKEIISTLFVFFNPRVNQNTKKDELDLEEIKTKNDERITTVYFIVDEDKLDKLLPIIRMFYAIVFEKYMRNDNYKERFMKKDKRKEEKRKTRETSQT